ELKGLGLGNLDFDTLGADLNQRHGRVPPNLDGEKRLLVLSKRSNPYLANQDFFGSLSVWGQRDLRFADDCDDSFWIDLGVYLNPPEVCGNVNGEGLVLAHVEYNLLGNQLNRRDARPLLASAFETVLLQLAQILVDKTSEVPSESVQRAAH